jgi:uncharacterized protein
LPVSRVLIDTGPIVAILSASDEHHARCVAQLADLRPPLFTCWPVVTEAQWLLRQDPQAVQALFDAFTGGLLALLPVDAAALPAIAAFILRYSKRKPNLVDAMLVHLAEREDIATVFTLDRRDFSVYRFR